jgi:hypothetical protein
LSTCTLVTCAARLASLRRLRCAGSDGSRRWRGFVFRATFGIPRIAEVIDLVTCISASSFSRKQSSSKQESEQERLEFGAVQDVSVRITYYVKIKTLADSVSLVMGKASSTLTRPHVRQRRHLILTASTCIHFSFLCSAIFSISAAFVLSRKFGISLVDRSRKYCYKITSPVKNGIFGSALRVVLSASKSVD